MSAAELRSVFDQDAELYDRARPGYPPELFDDLVGLADVLPDSRVLEIGPGTGQATLDLAGRGAYVTAVELGESLAALLRRKVASAAAGRVEVIVADFDRWPAPQGSFDAVAAFTAWHWLDPAVRAAKTAAALRTGGSLATVTTTHVRGGTESFFADSQACYARWDPDTPAGGFQLPPAAELPAASDEVDGSPLFGPPTRLRYERDLTYPTRAFLDVLNTYSGTRSLDPVRREGLLRCIAALADESYGGRITKRYLYELRVARKG